MTLRRRCSVCGLIMDVVEPDQRTHPGCDLVEESS